MNEFIFVLFYRCYDYSKKIYRCYMRYSGSSSNFEGLSSRIRGSNAAYLLPHSVYLFLGPDLHRIAMEVTGHAFCPWVLIWLKKEEGEIKMKKKQGEKKVQLLWTQKLYRNQFIFYRQNTGTEKIHSSKEGYNFIDFRFVTFEIWKLCNSTQGKFIHGSISIAS